MCQQKGQITALILSTLAILSSAQFNHDVVKTRLKTVPVDDIVTMKYYSEYLYSVKLSRLNFVVYARDMDISSW